MHSGAASGQSHALAPRGADDLPSQASAAQRASSALYALQRACAIDGPSAMPAARVGEMRPGVDVRVDDEQDLEPDEYDASSDDADDAAYCMQPVV